MSEKERLKAVITAQAVAIMALLEILGIPPGEETEMSLKLAARLAGEEGARLLTLTPEESKAALELELDFLISGR